jgi:PIN domain nuclease of toxin-antitoxin system
MIAVEPRYVVDTHALIWHLKANPALGRSAAAVFAAAARGQTLLLVPSIVIAEMYYVDNKHGLFRDFATVFHDLNRQAYIQMIALTAHDVLDFGRDNQIPEMHDRIIVGVARRFSAPLLSQDTVITAFDRVKTVWS